MSECFYLLLQHSVRGYYLVIFSVRLYSWATDTTRHRKHVFKVGN